MLRIYLDEVCPKLPNSSHVAVLLYCWGRGNTVRKDGRYMPVTQFSEAISQIAKGTSMSESRVYQIIRDLENMGVIVTSNRKNPGRAPKRRILIPGYPKDGSWPADTPSRGANNEPV